MQQLLVINTGGTIGMAASDNGLVPAPNFLEHYCHTHLFQPATDVTVTWYEWSPLIDSSQIHPNQWNELAQIITDHDDKHDAFLIIHGTDTLAYTASALSFMLRGFNKPIIITGSMRSIQESNSDGPNNLKLAFETCFDKQHRGVWVCFDGGIYPGSHVTKIDAVAPHAFTAPIPSDYTGLNILRPELPLNVRWIDTKKCAVDVFTFYPGCQFDSLGYMSTSSSRAIILKSFGSGNVPESGELTHHLRTAMVANKIVVNVSQCLASSVDMARYDAGGHLLRIGVLSAFTMTFEAALTKLMVLLSEHSHHDIIAQQFGENWGYEIPQPRK